MFKILYFSLEITRQILGLCLQVEPDGNQGLFCATTESNQQFKTHVLVSVLQILQCIADSSISLFFSNKFWSGLGSLLKLCLFWTHEKLGLFHSEGVEQILHFIFLMLSQEQEGICNCLCRSFCFPQQQFQHCKCSPASLTVNTEIHQTLLGDELSPYCQTLLFNEMVSAVCCEYKGAYWLLLWTNAFRWGAQGKAL